MSTSTRLLSVVAAAVTVAGSVVVTAGAAQAAPRDTPDTVMASTNAAGVPGNRFSDRPQVSGATGRYVTYDSFATNLLPGTTTSVRRVYRKDMLTGAVEPVSAASGSTAISDSWSSFTWPSDDGNQVAFVSDAVALARPVATKRSVYVRTMSTHATELISVNNAGQPADDASSRPMISGDGRFVAFSSKATNLPTAGGGNGQEQVYVRDRVARTTTLVSVAVNGGPGNAQSYRGMVSADGRYVTWASKATNLTPGSNPVGMEAIYVRDLQAGVTTRVTVRPGGVPGAGSRPYLTPDGRFVAFNSYDIFTAGDAINTSDTFVWDRTTHAIERIAQSGTDVDPNGDSLRLFLSDDARFATWNSFANNLVSNDRNPSGDVFLKDRTTGRTTLLSLSWYGGPGDQQSFRPVFTNDASKVVFQSRARNLVPHDTSLDWQVYQVTTASVTGPGLDTVRPTFLGSSPPAGTTQGASPVVFSGTVTDDRSVDRAFVQVKNTANGTWLQADGTWGPAAARLAATLGTRWDASTTWRFDRALPAGSYAYQVGATDSANNTASGPLLAFRVQAARAAGTSPRFSVVAAR